MQFCIENAKCAIFQIYSTRLFKRKFNDTLLQYRRLPLKNPTSAMTGDSQIMCLKTTWFAGGGLSIEHVELGASNH